MSQFQPVLESLKQEDYSAKKQLLEYMLHILQNIQRSKKHLEQGDKAAILQYAFEEVDALLSAIPKAASYKEKDNLFECEDLLLGLIMHLCPDSGEIPQENFEKIQLLVKTVAQERYIETCIDDLFQQDSIGAVEAKHLISLAKQTADEYQKGKLYAGLVHYKKEIARLSEDAKAVVTAYLTEEFRRYLAQTQLTADCVNNLELAADVSQSFADDGLIGLVYALLKLGYGNVNYYAVSTLLALGREVPAETIVSLAQNLEYANLTYALLGNYGKQTLFPKELSTPEYLAKSDMVHWLTYPTELGEQPDAIEYIGKITYLFRKEVYYVFRYRSDSDTLDEHLKNKWLIGWSSEDGGTFSNFDEYALYEKGTVSATLKNIKKQLLG